MSSNQAGSRSRLYGGILVFSAILRKEVTYIELLHCAILIQGQLLRVDIHLKHHRDHQVLRVLIGEHSLRFYCQHNNGWRCHDIVIVGVGYYIGALVISLLL